MATIVFAGENPNLFFGDVIDSLRSKGHQVLEIKTAADLFEALVSGCTHVAVVEGPLLGEEWNSTTGFDTVIRARAESKNARNTPTVLIKTIRDPLRGGEIGRNMRIVPIPVLNDQLLRAMDQVSERTLF